MTATRRIITGLRDGRSVLVADELRPGIALTSIPGFHFNEIWTTESTARHPAPITHTPSGGWLPSAGGTQFQIVVFPPDAVLGQPDFDPVAAAEEQRRLFPGVASHFDPDHPGMHATPTVDYAIMLQGRIILELDDGASLTLAPGDVVVQNGARHAWRNPGDAPATLAFILVGVLPANAVDPTTTYASFGSTV